ncbi:hypothetical protein [Methanobrevibacter sp.]
MRIWLVDYIDPHNDSPDCLVVEAESYDSAFTIAVGELKILKIPKRYILKIEEF